MRESSGGVGFDTILGMTFPDLVELYDEARTWTGEKW